MVVLSSESERARRLRRIAVASSAYHHVQCLIPDTNDLCAGPTRREVEIATTIIDALYEDEQVVVSWAT